MSLATAIKVLDIGVWWGDGCVNDPILTFLLDRAPARETYEKRPCDQAMRRRSSGWHIYYTEDDGFAWFFTWGGEPDNGFGGWRRRVRLTDGSEEEVVGGWHVSADVAESAGFAPCVDAAYRTDYRMMGLESGERRLDGGVTTFVEAERFRREVERLRPDLEVVESQYLGLTVKWRDQPSKAEFVELESARQDPIRAALRGRYGGGWDWWARATLEEREALETRPYSALGAVS